MPYDQVIICRLLRMSPTSLKVTLRLLRELEGASLAKCLAAEFRTTQRYMARRHVIAREMRMRFGDARARVNTGTRALAKGHVQAHYLHESLSTRARTRVLLKRGRRGWGEKETIVRFFTF